jgi:hypothetical protein
LGDSIDVTESIVLRILRKRLLGEVLVENGYQASSSLRMVAFVGTSRSLRAVHCSRADWWTAPVDRDPVCLQVALLFTRLALLRGSYFRPTLPLCRYDPCSGVRRQRSLARGLVACSVEPRESRNCFIQSIPFHLSCATMLSMFIRAF